MATPMELDVISKKRERDDDEEMPPTKVFVVEDETVPMDIDPPIIEPLVFINLFPVPRLVRCSNFGVW